MVIATQPMALTAAPGRRLDVRAQAERCPGETPPPSAIDLLGGGLIVYACFSDRAINPRPPANSVSIRIVLNRLVC